MDPLRNLALKYQSSFTALLTLIFGISAWVQINGLWVETPVLVQILPEGWSLASHIVILTQLANVGPVLYSVLKYKCNVRNHDKLFIHVTFVIGTLSCLLLVFYWNNTTFVFGKSRSVIFLFLTTMLAVVDCTTSVLYLPFMTNYKSKFLMYYFIGEGFSGLIPSIVSFIQGVQESPTCNGTQVVTYPEPRFSVEAFFVFLTVMVAISWISFVLLTTESLVGDDASAPQLATSSQTQPPVDGSESNLLDSHEVTFSRTTVGFLMACQAYACALTNGLLPGIQSFSCMPYGNFTYHLAVNVAVLSNPIFSWIAFFRRSLTSYATIVIATSIATLSATYLFVMALYSPNPPMRNLVGSTLLVCAWFTFAALFSFVKASIARILRSHASNSNKLLFWCGVFTQTGSLIGALVSFVLVNYTALFTPYYPCSK